MTSLLWQDKKCKLGSILKLYQLYRLYEVLLLLQRRNQLENILKDGLNWITCIQIPTLLRISFAILLSHVPFLRPHLLRIIAHYLTRSLWGTNERPTKEPTGMPARNNCAKSILIHWVLHDLSGDWKRFKLLSGWTAWQAYLILYSGRDFMSYQLSLLVAYVILYCTMCL